MRRKMKRRRKNLWKKEANLAGQSAAGVLAWTGTCMWAKKTTNGGRDMGKQRRKSAETDHSRMRGDRRPEKHLSVQTGHGRDGEEEDKTVKEKKKKKKKKKKEKEKEEKKKKIVKEKEKKKKEKEKEEKKKR